MLLGVPGLTSRSKDATRGGAVLLDPWIWIIIFPRAKMAA